MSKPIIGVLGSVRHVQLGGFETRSEIFVLEKYMEGVIQAGGVPLIIYSMEDKKLLDSYLSLCEGLLMPGGYDIDPRIYNENPHSKLQAVFPHLDAAWHYCARYAIAKDMPTLGICRGLQMLNIAAGGSLYQDIQTQMPDAIQHFHPYNRENLIHKIDIMQDSRLYGILGSQTVYSNTLHHQSIKEMGKGLMAVAWTEDGIIEAIENESGQIVGVQWHPEELLNVDRRMLNIFVDLIEKCKCKDCHPQITA